MIRRLLPALLLCVLMTAPPAMARDKNETWQQISTPHFVVITNGSEKQGRRVGIQFERMRLLLHAVLPEMKGDSGAPIIVLAIKDEKDFRGLEPREYLTEGSLHIGGLFLRVPDKNYVLMRLDAEGEHPYAVMYHEYTHLLLSHTAEWMPLWLSEGLAEYYENTDIYEKEGVLGQPSAENLSWLRQKNLIPLTTLFMIDHKSPYYHEENKGSIFYAESWALVHYLLSIDLHNKTQLIIDYDKLLVQHVDPVTAAAQAFGDLTNLEKALEKYVHRVMFTVLKQQISTNVDESTFKVQTLTPAQSDAQRADFLAYNQRIADAQALLDQVLKEDPNNVLAHETKGLIEFHEGHLDEARKWYAKAVQLDSHSFLAHYYFAATTMNRSDVDQAQVESSLRTAISLNPQFAPAYDLLAVYLAMHREKLDEARMMSLTAITLEPANVGYRINMANIYMTMAQGDNAVSVLHAAAKLAKTPEESQAVDTSLIHAQEYAEARKRFDEEKQRREEEDKEEDKEEATKDTEPVVSSVPAPPKRAAFVPKGPHKFVVGVLKGVHCDNPELDLTVAASGKQLALHADNYYKVPFSALGFQPDADLNPCKDLESRPAKVEYIESADPAVHAQLISVELHK